jgi:hypothetical protein
VEEAPDICRMVSKNVDRTILVQQRSDHARSCKTRRLFGTTSPYINRFSLCFTRASTCRACRKEARTRFMISWWRLSFTTSTFTAAKNFTYSLESTTLFFLKNPLFLQRKCIMGRA